MDFFNKLSKKATETYQVAKEKTTNISEEIKAKTKITSLEDKNYEIYAEIGKLVYNELKAGNDVSKVEVELSCDTITKNLEEIEKLKMQLLDLKNLRKCANCGAEIDEKAEFCPKCGAAQTEQSTATEVKEAEIVEINNDKE